MSSERVDVRISINTDDATEKLTDAWWRVARLAHPQLSEEELEDLARAELQVARNVGKKYT